MKKVILLAAMIFSFSALTFAKSAPTAADLSKKITAALAKQDKNLAADAAVVNALTQKAQQQIANGTEDFIEITVTVSVSVTVGNVTVTVEVSVTISL